MLSRWSPKTPRYADTTLCSLLPSKKCSHENGNSKANKTGSHNGCSGCIFTTAVQRVCDAVSLSCNVEDRAGHWVAEVVVVDEQECWWSIPLLCEEQVSKSCSVL